MRNKILLALLIVLSLSLSASPAFKAPEAKDFTEICDSLKVLMQERMGVWQEKLKVDRVSVKGSSINLYFSNELSDYPWRKEDIRWFTSVLKELSKSVTSHSIGRIFTNQYELKELALPLIGNNGKPVGYDRATRNPKTKPIVYNSGGKKYFSGLYGRHIALWQSHGKYYDENRGEWVWQRAGLHRTIEDILTPSFVLPFLIPMLENAGAYVMTPRERDIQWREIIADNDQSFGGQREGKLRREGSYYEKGQWNDAGVGFADFKQSYVFEDNPFTAGTAKMANCSGDKANSQAIWTANIEERGEYAVYVSYKSLPNSNEEARYTVQHMGGSDEFIVNQKQGGGTWIYLGTFEFDKGGTCAIILDNRGKKGRVVTADAVKIGGGMGKLEREGKLSGLASWEEGAHYWMQWAGANTTITCNWDNDYTNDFGSRGPWTVMMKEQKNIPIDLSLAFHTDAGIGEGDETIGTLAIYTLKCEGKREFSDGRDRIISRLLCDYVQTQLVNDLRLDFTPNWNRRGLSDRSYSESRTTGVPAILLELLSHQNLEDMKYGLDPAFRFTASRAVYKGILKSLSEFYNCNYVVQPLPVQAFSVSFAGNDKVRLEWKPTPDPKEPTAVSRGYTVYTRVDGGAFDSGVDTKTNSIELSIKPGHLYSFKVEAYNEGGKSFPSEILSVGIPSQAVDSRTVVIVNNFDRVSAPVWIDSPEYAGFTAFKDSGVPYIRDISYAGENYEFSKSAEFVSNDYPGFGASHTDQAGNFVAGNTFDYPYVHGKALMELGYSFFSTSRDAFCNAYVDSPALSQAIEQAFALDLICGKQGDKFKVFPEQLQVALSAFAYKGGNIFISGSNIASDCVDFCEDFISELLGYSMLTPDAGNKREIEVKGTSQKRKSIAYSNSINPEIYCIESPDAIKPYGENAAMWLKFSGSHLGAAVCKDGTHYKSVALSIPLETIISEADRLYILDSVMKWFSSEGKNPALL